MNQPVTLVAAFKRRGGMRRDVGEGGAFIIEFDEKQAALASLAIEEHPKTFYLTFTGPVTDAPAEVTE